MSTNNNILNELILPELNSIEYGQGINSIISNINDNFQRIVESDYLRGPKGDSIILLEYNVKTDQDNNGTLLKDDIFAAIIDGLDEDVYNGLTSDDVEGKISIIYESADNEESRIITSLPFIFIDPRYKDLTDIKRFENIEDCSCIVQYSEGSFKAIKTFPTLYYDKNVGQFCWRINGTDTGLLARGPKGERGENGNIYIMKIDSQVSSNKYIVSPLIEIDDEKWSNKINNGDFAFVFNTQTSEYYIGLLKMENNNIYAIINDNPIYDQFLGHSFYEFLKKIYITNTDGTPKGLFIPISTNDEVVSAHMLCATPISNNLITDVSLVDSVSTNNVNLNLLPVTNINSVTASSINVIRDLVISISHLGTDLISNANISFKSLIIDKDTLKTQLNIIESNVVYIINKIYGIELTNYNDINDDYCSRNNPLYYFANDDGTIRLFSNKINIYDSNNICCEFAYNSIRIITDKTFTINIENNTYVKNADTPAADYSLNFGYDYVNIGTEKGAYVNINGSMAVDDIHTKSIETFNTITNSIESDQSANLNIYNPHLHSARVHNTLNIDSDISITDGAKNTIINSSSIVSNNNFEIDTTELHVTSTKNNNGKLVIDIPTEINGEVSINYGATTFHISNTNANNYSWPTTSYSTSTIYKSLSNGGSLNGAKNTSNSWRKHMDSITADWSLEWPNIGSASKTEIEFKPLVLGFKYQGRSYRNGNTDCPKFTYKIDAITLEYDVVNGGTTTKKTITGTGTNGWRTQLKYTSNGGGTYFADNDSGSTYTDYVTITIPKIKTEDGEYINRVKIIFSASMDGDNDSSVWTTCGDIYINSLKTGYAYNTYTGNSISTSLSLSSVSTGSNFIKITKYNTTGGIRTIVCNDGIMIGKNSQNCGKLIWNGTALDIVKGKLS